MEGRWHTGRRASSDIRDFDICGINLTNLILEGESENPSISSPRGPCSRESTKAAPNNLCTGSRVSGMIRKMPLPSSSPCMGIRVMQRRGCMG